MFPAGVACRRETLHKCPMFTRVLRSLLPLACAASAPILFAAPATPPQYPPEYIEALRTAVRAFADRDFPKTLEALDKADKLMPPTPITLNTRGAILIEQRKFEEGAELCKRALAIDPKFYPARFNLCEIPMMQKKYAEARELFQKILDEQPKDELVMYRILLTYLIEKNDTEARRTLDRIPFPGKTAAYYYGNAAWEFAHGNQEEGHKWVKRGNWVFNQQMTINFSDPLKDAGWLTESPGVTTTLPDLEAKGIGGPTKLELAPPDAAPLLTPEKKEAPVPAPPQN
jgi:tetratricopeptide (TPR) repeat protein